MNRAELSMDDDSFERDLFRARARSMDLPALPPVETVIARAEARRCARVISPLPVGAFARLYDVFARTVAPVAMVHAAAGIFVLVAWGAGVHTERVRVDAPTERGPMMSIVEPEDERGTCGAAASFFGMTCETVPASMPVASHATPGSCDAPPQSYACLASEAAMPSAGDAICSEPFGAACGDFVTCADARP